jgi:N6-adenosine-specific RNA methylase IME4
MATSRELVLLSRAQRALAEARTVDELCAVREQAEAVRYAMKVRGYSLDAQNDAAEIRLGAERRLGALTREQPKAKGARGPGRGKAGHAAGPAFDPTPSYAALGLTKQQAARWQALAAIPDDQLAVYVANVRRQGERLTTHGALRLTRRRTAQHVVANNGARVDDLAALAADGARFGTIYADPPWRYDNAGTRAAAGDHYVTMTVDEIAALPVAALAAADAHLHLWTTNAFLFDAQRVLEAWGFAYRSVFVWVKPKLGIGNYWRVSHEFLVLGVRGRVPFADHGIRSWLEHPRGPHSAKPERIRLLVERVSPGPRLELFGRRTTLGWTVWGNQIERGLWDGASDTAAG